MLFQATLYVISNNILWFQHACHIMCLKPGKTSLQAEKHYIKLFQLLKKCNFIFNQQSGIQATLCDIEQHDVISSFFDIKKHCMWFQATLYVISKSMSHNVLQAGNALLQTEKHHTSYFNHKKGAISIPIRKVGFTQHCIMCQATMYVISSNIV